MPRSGGIRCASFSTGCVRQSPRELAHRFHLLRLPQVGFRRHQLRRARLNAHLQFCVKPLQLRLRLAERRDIGEAFHHRRRTTTLIPAQRLGRGYHQPSAIPVRLTQVPAPLAVAQQDRLDGGKR